MRRKHGDIQAGPIRYITRPAHRRQQVLAHLRAAIVAGEYPSGGRLPTRRELEKSLRASRLTVQAVLDRLAADGFVEARGRHGTFMVDQPPHRHRFALVLPPSSPYQAPSLFIDALHREVALLEGEHNHRFVVYPTVDGEHGEGYQGLAEDVRAERLAGIIYVSAVDRFGLAGLDTIRVPLVAINSGVGVQATVVPNYASFYDLATAEAARQGRRRLAMLTLGSSFAAVQATIGPLMTARGLELRRAWFHSLSSGRAGWARNVVELLLAGPPPKRPDLLLVADDNLLTETTEALRELRVRVPEDLTVLAHTNFPWPAPAAVPVVRLGFDVGDLLRACLAQIEALRRGEAVPPVTYLPAGFEKDGQEP